jgi:hypothetical protein
LRFDALVLELDYHFLGNKSRYPNSGYNQIDQKSFNEAESILQAKRENELLFDDARRPAATSKRIVESKFLSRSTRS